MLATMDRETIGSQIRALRLARGWTIREAAKRCGVDFRTLGQIELGRTNWTADKILRIAEGLGAALRFTAEPPSEASPERQAIASRFMRVLPHLPDEDLDVFVHELALWERRYGSGA